VGKEDGVNGLWGLDGSVTQILFLSFVDALGPRKCTAEVATETWFLT
jgi:hypothetical protein